MRKTKNNSDSVIIQDSIIEKTNKKIDFLVTERNRELTEIRQKIEAALAEIESLEKELQKASESSDINTYINIKNKIELATSTVEMYRIKEAKIVNNDLASDQETNETMNLLNEYETNLDLEYKKAMSDIFKKAHSLNIEYRSRMTEAFNTKKAWHDKIHDVKAAIRGVTPKASSESIVIGRFLESPGIKELTK